MSLEQALAENTAALQAMTAAMLKGGAASSAGTTDAKAGTKTKAAAYEAKHTKEDMQAAMQAVKEKLGIDAAKKIRSEVAKVDKLADLTDAKTIDAVYEAAKKAIEEADDGM